MIERYTRMVADRNILYSKDVPALILFNSILYDNVNHKLALQAKYEHFMPIAISSITIIIELIDSNGIKIDIQEAVYNNLHVSKGIPFGDDLVVTLNNSSVKKTRLAICKIDLTNGEHYEYNRSEWKVMKKPEELKQHFDSYNYYMHYQELFGNDKKICNYITGKAMDLRMWMHKY